MSQRRDRIMSLRVGRSIPGCWSAFVLGLACTLGAPAEAGFTITDLGPLGLGQSGGATGINAQGGTAGIITSSGTTSAAQADPGGGFRLINTAGLPGVTSSSSAAINSGGAVTGSFYDGITKQSHAFLSLGGQAVDIGAALGGKLQGANSWGVAINSSGVVLGNAQTNDGSKFVFRSGGGAAAPISLPGGSLVGQAGGLNNSGTAVGSYITSLGVSRVFIDQAGKPATDLLTSYSVRGFGLNTYGSAINDRGDVVGSGDFNGQSHAFFASSQGKFADLGVLNGFNSSVAIAINSQGQVVGAMSNNGSNSRAFLWDQTAGLFDLNSLLGPTVSGDWTLTSATGINDSDQIAGQGYFDGQLHGFVLTPAPGSPLFAPSLSVPTPPSASLALGCLVLVGGWLRIKRGRTAAPATA